MLRNHFLFWRQAEDYEVVVEAMARSSCIGTNVGGIPELLDKDVIIVSIDLVLKVSKLNNADY